VTLKSPHVPVQKVGTWLTCREFVARMKYPSAWPRAPHAKTSMTLKPAGSLDVSRKLAGVANLHISHGNVTRLQSASHQDNSSQHCSPTTVIAHCQQFHALQASARAYMLKPSERYYGMSEMR